MARFTLDLTLRDRQGFQQPISLAIDVDAAIRISARAVDEMKTGLGSFDGAVELMRTKEMRKGLLKDLAMQLGAQLADRMEDAEGWHDASRIEPARAQLGGSWEG